MTLMLFEPMLFAPSHLSQIGLHALMEELLGGCECHHGGTMFQRTGVFFLTNFLTNGVHNMLVSGMRETILQITSTYAMKGFRGDNQHLELHSEANRQLMQLTEQGVT